MLLVTCIARRLLLAKQELLLRPMQNASTLVYNEHTRQLLLFQYQHTLLDVQVQFLYLLFPNRGNRGLVMSYWNLTEYYLWWIQNLVSTFNMIKYVMHASQQGCINIASAYVLLRKLAFVVRNPPPPKTKKKKRRQKNNNKNEFIIKFMK